MAEYRISESRLSQVERVLIIQTAFIGDAILSTPIFKGMKSLLPNVHLDVLAIPQTSNIFKYNPYIENVYEFDKRKLRRRIISFFKVLWLIRKNRYDLAISVQSSFTSSVLMVLGAIPVRIGYPRQKLLTHTVVLEKGLHIRKRVLKLLAPIKDSKVDDDTELYWSEKEDNKIHSYLNEKGKKRIVIAPGSAQFTKQWPLEYFISLVKGISEENGLAIYLIGGAEDWELCEKIKRSANNSCQNLAGKLSLIESAALIKNVDLVISNDSAPTHIANAVKTDVFAIFGPTVTKLGFYPYRDGDRVLEIDLECRPCGKHGGKKCPLGHFKCMLELRPDIVINEVKEKLKI